jgi:A/G-specific adenine glycosylase
VRTKKGKRPVRVFAAVLCENRNAIWLLKREQKLLQGLWEFPSVPFHPLADSKNALEKKFLETFGFRVLLGKEIGSIDHEYTHFKQRITLFSGRIPEKQGVKWTQKKALSSLPLSKANQKLLEITYKESF